jgi:hypothetical protein
LLLFFIALPASVEAKTPEPIPAVDLGILEQTDVLVPYMSTAQKLEYLNFEKALEEAESNLRSGRNLANTKPSSLDPNRDIKPSIERGKALVAQSKATIQTLQIELAQLLEAVDAERKQQQAVDLTKYDYALESTELEEAWTPYTRQLLESCWELGYETLFFDGVYIHESEGTRQADARIRNHVYDILVKIDGPTFSVTLPVNLQLKADTTGNDSGAFSYENAAIFKKDKKALLAFELITPKGSTSGLLSLRAIDLDGCFGLGNECLARKCRDERRSP